MRLASALCAQRAPRAFAVLPVLALVQSLGAQPSAPEPLRDAILAGWDQPGLRVNALIRALGDYQPDRVAAGRNGFQVFEARLGVSGELDGGWRYQLQTGVTRAPALLDVRIGKRFSPSLLVDIGRFKADFSREWIAAISDADFTGRSEVALALAPARQTGVQGRAAFLDRRVEVSAGAFNGNATHTGNDDDNLMLTGRVGLWLLAPSTGGRGGWEVALNGMQSRDAAAPIGTLLPSFAGQRQVGGVESWFRGERLLLGAEYIAARLDSLGGQSYRPRGWQATLGWKPVPTDQVLVRWDVLRTRGLGRDVDDLVLGWNHWSTRASEVQVNWRVPLGDVAWDRHRLVVSLQFML